MEQVLNKILDALQSLQQGQDEIKAEVKEINRKTDIIFNQTAHLTEFTTATTSSLNTIESKLTLLEEKIDTIEKVTAKNCYDITHLKAIK